MRLPQSAARWTRKVERLLDVFEATVNLHPTWKLAALGRAGDTVTVDERTILLALLGKRLAHLPPDAALFTGGGLARAAADRRDEARRTIGLLRADSHLVREDLICPCGGVAELMSDDPLELEMTEFELADKGAEMLGLDKKAGPRRRGEFQARQPMVRLEHLVLGGRVRQAVDLALVHARNSRRLMDDWGLGELIPYGRGTVLLFSGPPGTGKTATAEALAHELEKPILVADYSRIQNCFVGQTEKNIVRVFREARSQDAVLFWDEADAMFYDRDLAARTWEVRDVNVLLQQLERFEGTCILATNRKVSLDKALERRIALKVDFELPDRAQRRRFGSGSCRQSCRLPVTWTSTNSASRTSPAARSRTSSSTPRAWPSSATPAALSPKPTSARASPFTNPAAGANQCAERLDSAGGLPRDCILRPRCGWGRAWRLTGLVQATYKECFEYGRSPRCGRTGGRFCRIRPL